MKLHSPQFEKKLRRGVKQALRRSRQWKRSSKPVPTQYQMGVLGRPVLSIFFAFIVWTVGVETKHAASALALINIWSLCLVFINAQLLRVRLYSAPDLPALSLLPLNSGTMFRWEVQSFVRRAPFSLLDFLLGYGALGCYLDLPVSKWLALPVFAILNWLLVLCFSALCLARLPRLNYPLIYSCIWIFVALLPFTSNYIGRYSLALLDGWGPDLNLILPMGWPGTTFMLALVQGYWAALLLLIPIGGLIATVRDSLRRLEASYMPQEITRPEAPDLVPPGAEPPPVSIANPENPPHLGEIAIEEIVRAHSFQQFPAWHQRGFIENLLWQWFTPRERALAEFAFPAGIALTTPWNKIFRTVTVTVLLAAGLGYLSPQWKVLSYWMLAGGFFVSICQILYRFLNNGRAFAVFLSNGVNIPMYAGYAIGFRELALVLFKYSLVQMPFVLFFTVSSIVLGLFLASQPVWPGVIMGFKAAGLLCASRLILIPFAFSGGTNDASKFRPRTIALIAMVIFFCVLFLFLGGAGLFVPDQGPAWLLWLAAIADAYAFYKIYGWFYNANRFDLMRIPQK